MEKFRGWNVEDVKNIDLQTVGDYEDFWDREEFVDTLLFFLKEYNHYLIVGYNSDWRGRTGYSLVNDVIDTVLRNYDVTQNIIGVTNSRKSLLIMEYSHDVPMGHKTLIVGLTDNEYEKLENSSYEKVMDFADKKEKTIIRI